MTAPEGNPFVWSQQDLKRKRGSEESSYSDSTDDDNHLLRNYSKFTRLEIEKSLQAEYKSSGFKCQFTSFCARLPSFFTASAYEDHYSRFHTQVCKECSRVLPTAHLLDLHICELHDSYFAVLSARKPLYKCFVDDCQIFSANPSDRIKHLCAVHKYPKKFNFDIVLGEDRQAKKKSKRKRNRKNYSRNILAGSKKEAGEEEKSKEMPDKNVQNEPQQDAMSKERDGEMDLDELTDKMSSVSLMIPSNIKFGKRGGFKKYGAVSLDKVKSLHDERAPKSSPL